MLIIGLTGPSGSGKGTVSSLFAAHGVPAIDTDRVYHHLLIPPSACLDELVARFGNCILNPDGSLDRKALAAVIFAPGQEQAREDLNRITHKYVLDRVRKMCRTYAEDGCLAVLVDAPLLFESGFDKECDRTLAILADRDIRMARIMARDGMTADAAEARLQAQKSDIFYVDRADAVIYNNGALEDMVADVRRLLTEWGVMA